MSYKSPCHSLYRQSLGSPLQRGSHYTLHTTSASGRTSSHNHASALERVRRKKGEKLASWHYRSGRLLRWLGGRGLVLFRLAYDGDNEV
jgi:hypothetical protein